MAEPDWNYGLDKTVEGRLVTALIARLKSLSLKSIPNNRIIFKKLAWLFGEEQLETPCVLVIPSDELTGPNEGTNERDDTEFGFFIITILANGRDVTDKGAGLQFGWRQAIRRGFRNLSSGRWPELVLDDGSNFLRGKIESGSKFIPAAKMVQLDASYYLIRLVVREPRAAA